MGTYNNSSMLVQFMCRSLPPLRIYFLVVNAYPHVSLCAYKTPPHMCVYVFLLRNGLFMSHIVLSVQLLVLLLLSTYFSIKLCFFSLSSCGRLYAGIFPYITADLVFGSRTKPIPLYASYVIYDNNDR